MRIPVDLTYEMVEKRHSKELVSLIQKLRNSSSKMKDANPENMTFEYNYAMSCGAGFTGKQFIDYLDKGIPLPEHKTPTTVEGKVKDWLERATPVVLTGKIGRWRGTERVPNPPELEETFRRDAEQEVKEEQRLASLSDEERQQEINDILQNLSSMGGTFIGFKL